MNKVVHRDTCPSRVFMRLSLLKCLSALLLFVVSCLALSPELSSDCRHLTLLKMSKSGDTPPWVYENYPDYPYQKHNWTPSARRYHNSLADKAPEHGPMYTCSGWNCSGGTWDRICQDSGRTWVEEMDF